MKPHDAPGVSLVSVNYNGFDDTCEMIRSVVSVVRSVSYEIIVVDNASQRDEAAMLRELFPQVKVIRSPRNLGFSGGNNLGFEVSEGRYIFLINNDTYLKEDGLGDLVAFMDAHPEIGAVSPKILYDDEKEVIQFAGATPLSPVTIRNKSLGYGELDRGQWDQPAPTGHTHGAAMMVRREVIDRVGGMPELYFLYYEELDWCAAIERAGYRLWYYPGLKVYHKESKSTGKESPLKRYYMTRNRLLYAWRNLSPGKRAVSVAYQMCVAVPKSYLTSLLKGEFKLAAATRCGAGAFLTLKGKKR